MQAILKSEYHKLCNCLEEIRDREPPSGIELNQLEEELHAIFRNYQQKMDELKEIVEQYERKQKIIKIKIKKFRIFPSPSIIRTIMLLTSLCKILDEIVAGDL